MARASVINANEAVRVCDEVHDFREIDWSASEEVIIPVTFTCFVLVSSCVRQCQINTFKFLGCFVGGIN